MELRTFISAGKLTLTVPESAIKLVDVVRDDKARTYQASVVFSADGVGPLRARLDLTKLVEPEDNDLESITSTVTRSVYYGNDPVPILSVTRLSPGGGDDAGSAFSPSPAGPNLEVK